jgi:hypothetical protein
VPVLELIALGVGLTVLCLVCGWVVSEALLPSRGRGGRSMRVARRPAVDEPVRELVR